MMSNLTFFFSTRVYYLIVIFKSKVNTDSTITATMLLLTAITAAAAASAITVAYINCWCNNDIGREMQSEINKE